VAAALNSRQSLRARPQHPHATHNQHSHYNDSYADGDRPGDQADRDGVQRCRRRLEACLLIDCLRRGRVQVHPQSWK